MIGLNISFEWQSRQREFGLCVWDPRHSIHAGETPRTKRHPCWSCLVHNLCVNTGFNQQILGIRYDLIISGNPVDIRIYFMSRHQLASKVPRLKFATLIQFGNFSFLRHRIGNVTVCRLTVQLDYSVLNQAHQITFGINFQGRLWRGVSHNIRQCNAAVWTQNSNPTRKSRTLVLEDEAALWTVSFENLYNIIRLLRPSFFETGTQSNPGRPRPLSLPCMHQF